MDPMGFMIKNTHTHRHCALFSLTSLRPASDPKKQIWGESAAQELRQNYFIIFDSYNKLEYIEQISYYMILYEEQII